MIKSVSAIFNKSFVCIALFACSTLQAHPALHQRNSKQALILAQDETHKVKPGETLTSISRKYGVTVADLLRWNPEAANLKAGQIIIVKKSNETTPTTNNEVETSGSVHKVKPGETLSAIARKYGVNVRQLQQWNGLKGGNIAAGQELIVKADEAIIDKATPAQSVASNNNNTPSKPSVPQKNNYLVHTVSAGQTLSAISRQYGVSVADIKQLNELKSDVVQPGMQLQIPTPSIVPEPSETKPAQPLAETSKSESTTPITTAQTEENTKTISNTMGYTRVVETGFAEVIEDAGNNKKHLCLHRTAPVGSIVQVKNEMNGNTIFVRVIGKLPETGPNEKLLVRLSKRAFESLSPASKRVPVEVSYPSPQAE